MFNSSIIINCNGIFLLTTKDYKVTENNKDNLKTCNDFIVIFSFTMIMIAAAATAGAVTQNTKNIIVVLTMPISKKMKNKSAF